MVCLRRDPNPTSQIAIALMSRTFKPFREQIALGRQGNIGGNKFETLVCKLLDYPSQGQRCLVSVKTKTTRGFEQSPSHTVD